MSYFLYEKSAIKNFEEFQKASYKSPYSAIRIAVENKGNKLNYTFKQFMAKYFTMFEYGSVNGNVEKVSAFKKFIQKHQTPSGENRFEVIGSDGTVFEPLDFIKFLEEHNARIDLNKTQIKRRLNPMQTRK